ncbi:sigma-70 family RNA polymerase sigma factor [Clostridium gasigenes]|uniref:sigma-70 family RNA polymerase sigma factor n=1 Tax=Clostridium gasigenes TaxID=94869 RepID=UPI0014383C3B|nr:sigma-70 family RNA polymerase sigma factor [Clostridium gasigenes]NKF07333.1 sigma-70 family RNA polymerase sigma factor [Clostridium gasigenes]QSW18306.1 sigma-70 family RNA polymerase sigma factor [Clostridium gasigenes]
MVGKENFLKQLKKKNPKALEYVIDTYSNGIFKVAYGVLNNRQLSEECLNDVFLKIWDNIHYFNREEDKFCGWILTIAKYTAIDILRKEVKHSKSIDISEINIGEEQCLESKIEDKDKLRAVTKEINLMKDIDKEIFQRKFYLDQSSKSVSEKMGLSDKFINLRIFRGRKKLLAKFNNEE